MSESRIEVAETWMTCHDCPHAVHARPCTHQVRGMDDLYRDCGCVTPDPNDEQEASA